MSVAIDWDLVSDRISGEVRKLRLTQAAVGKLIGISQSSVSSYQKGTSRKRPSIDSLASMAKVFEVSVDYLLGLTDDPHAPTSLDVALDGAEPGDYTLVPFLHDPIAAGSPLINTGEVGSYYAVRTDWKKRHTTGRLMFMQVARGYLGESMAPTILPGSVLTVDLGDRELKPGDIYVIRMPGEEGVTVKRVYVTDGTLIAVGDNRARPPWVAKLDDETTLDQVIIGKVVRWQSGED